MTKEKYIPLDRQFSMISEDQEDLDNNQLLFSLGHSALKTWADLEGEYRCVILAEAGAGKTEELRNRAKALSEQGRPSFFIRIEDIEQDFYDAFEVGTEGEFNGWLESTEEAWFFLDSVDEARLETPRAFESALRKFSKGIKKGAHRMHLYVSSRPYSWRPEADLELLNRYLFLAAKKHEDDSTEDNPTQPQSALTVLGMRPLDEERIRCFCEKRSVNDIDELLREIDRASIWSLAQRPLDLDSILSKWRKDKKLGSRLDLLEHSINEQLSDEHNIDRAQRQPLNLEQAHKGAQRLAAAVVMSGQSNINIPDASPDKLGIDARAVLSDWHPSDVNALLERGIFSDVIYGAVRFRHRDIREILAAKWFAYLIANGDSRLSIERLFIGEQYGETIIRPRLRPILPWLILWDDGIRDAVLRIAPEIAIEGGDPSKLSLPKRQTILKNIIRRIIDDENNGAGRDNGAIARIADAALTNDTLQLIDQHKENDDAIFFLARLVWQGKMTDCVAPLLEIALNPIRGIYSRITSARVVMTCGTDEQIQSLWRGLNQSGDKLPRSLLREIIDETEPTSENIQNVLLSLGRLQFSPNERFEANRLRRSLHQFIERMPIVGNALIYQELLVGLLVYLNTPPYVEKRECKVSEANSWLLSIAVHAVERLVDLKHPFSFSDESLFILMMLPLYSSWGGRHYDDYESNLAELIPNWSELNDQLYWSCIEQEKAKQLADSKSEPLSSDSSIFWKGHFWAFETVESFQRLLSFIRYRALENDQSIALSTAFRVYSRHDKPSGMLSKLKASVEHSAILTNKLDTLIDPPISEWEVKHQQEQQEYEHQYRLREEEEKASRNAWIADLKTNFHRLITANNTGEITNEHCWLMDEISGSSLQTNRSEGSDWRFLISDFGEDVALAYRDSAMNHWRIYTPTLQSESGRRSNSVSSALIFAVAGLEIEAAVLPEFPQHLSEPEVHHALRYITWEINGFPSWFESMYRTFPSLVTKAVTQELIWELENAELDLHYRVLDSLVFSAPWLHEDIATSLLEWLEANPNKLNPENRRDCIHLLISGKSDPNRLASIAKQEIDKSNDLDSVACWFALLVDSDPVNGIPQLEQWLEGIDHELVSRAAQIFVTALVGESHRSFSVPNIGYFKTPEHLKKLYVLMHKYIPSKDDINRADGGIYTPELRDDAQSARSTLFSLLCNMTGFASYAAIKQLIEEHPEPEYRKWMVQQAYKRAMVDGDLELWTVDQFCQFDKNRTVTPATHRQLFNHTVNRLNDLKNWLERGNDSPWRTWKRTEGETEMRTLIAGWLNQNSHGQYTTAQESELANGQRMDIWLHNTNVQSPVPVELKLLDKSWTGPKLKERLRNQLAGDYLRQEGAGCGVFLLVAQDVEPIKRWRIDDRLVNLSELSGALKTHWLSIAENYPRIHELEIIVIDLLERERFSDS
ncbi:hypothetical protein DN730_10820 [Marinomonas piezotolerans]|uniref:Uncharacterized protein n=1 Tax=Marinomonas piezotolerans TaxID=2213058 RepID=A0A370U8Q7_9GAMM|nr:hypothetical protein [Marinomonas piezotolerans]RDL44118.1 hypothetical protein DN730_10820 [Marinomonas piezotolerans]